MTSSNGIHYETVGDSADAIVFLHYFGSAGNTWRGIAGRLAPGIRCILPDLRGFGRSAAATAALRIEDHVADMQALIASLGLGRYLLVGHSMGGKVALALAARGLAGLQSVILLAPSPPTPEPMSDEDRHKLRQMYGHPGKIGDHLKEVTNQALETATIEQETALHLMAGQETWNAWIDGGSQEDISPDMSQVDVPVLIIGGGVDDGITPSVIATEVAEHLSQPEIKILPDTGHLLHLEQEDLVADAIRDWAKRYVKVDDHRP